MQKRGNEKKILKLREDRSKALAALQQLEVKLDIEDLPLLKRKKALEAELKKLEELKRERLSAAKPLLDKYNTIKTNLLELVKGSGDEGGASYPDLVVDNYLGAGGASALTELVDAREKEVRSCASIPCCIFVFFSRHHPHQILTCRFAPRLRSSLTRKRLRSHFSRRTRSSRQSWTPSLRTLTPLHRVLGLSTRS